MTKSRYVKSGKKSVMKLGTFPLYSVARVVDSPMLSIISAITECFSSYVDSTNLSFSLLILINSLSLNTRQYASYSSNVVCSFKIGQYLPPCFCRNSIERTTGLRPSCSSVSIINPSFIFSLISLFNS